MAPGLLTLLLLSVTLVGAYIIDDANSTIGYTGGPWVALSPTSENSISVLNGSAIIIDYSRWRGGTSTYARCVAATTVCRITIPFTGSGITIYGGLFWSVYTNFTVTLDGSATHPPVLVDSPPHAAPLSYNVTHYDLQSLSQSSHVLTLTLADWISAGYSDILFDYADITETAPSITTGVTSGVNTAPTPSSSSKSASSASSTASPLLPNQSKNQKKRKSAVAIAVGTAIGIVTAVAVLIMGLFYRRSRTSGEDDRGPQTGEHSPFGDFIVDPYVPISNLPIALTNHRLDLPQTDPGLGPAQHGMNMGEPVSASSTDFLSSPQTGPTQHAAMQGPAQLSSSSSQTAANVGPQFELNLYQPTVTPFPAIAHVLNGENTGPLPIEEQAEFNPYDQDAPAAVPALSPGVEKVKENVNSPVGEGLEGYHRPYIPQPGMGHPTEKMRGAEGVVSPRTSGPPPPYVDVQRR